MKTSNTSKNIALLSTAVIIPLVIAEIFLRCTDRYGTESEKKDGSYESLYHSPTQKRWYHIYEPHAISSQTLKEYSYSIYANNEGLLDKEFTVSKAPHTFRILVIGDSFIQGMGAPADSTCPRQLERILNARFGGKPEIEVWNCGIGNSDPVYEYILLKNRLLQYKPDYVIEAINSTDITDVIQRGGTGRFNADSTVSYRPAPWVEALYSRSYLLRSILRDIFKYDYMLLSPQQYTQGCITSARIIDSSLISFKTLCADNNIPLLTVFVPVIGEMVGFRDYTMAGFIRFCNEHQIQTVDLKEYFENNNLEDTKSFKLYWSVDMHFNSLGYSYFAKSISPPIISYIDSLNKNGPDFTDKGLKQY